MRKRTPSKTSSNRRSSASRSNQNEFSESNNELQELFLDELADIYNAEQQLTKALPKMAKAANSDELREAFEMHLEETEEQISRIEQAAEVMGESLKKKVCKGMKGLLEEGQEMMQEKKQSPAIDATLIAAAQKVEHYEIASYGTLCAWAKHLGQNEVLELLHETLEQEKTTDEKLTSLAESAANIEAEQAD
jgi:ferritin-like metal-binding protein YciE